MRSRMENTDSFEVELSDDHMPFCLQFHHFDHLHLHRVASRKICFKKTSCSLSSLERPVKHRHSCGGLFARRPSLCTVLLPPTLLPSSQRIRANCFRRLHSPNCAVFYSFCPAHGKIHRANRFCCSAYLVRIFSLHPRHWAFDLPGLWRRMGKDHHLSASRRRRLGTKLLFTPRCASETSRASRSGTRNFVLGFSTSTGIFDLYSPWGRHVPNSDWKASIRLGTFPGFGNCTEICRLKCCCQCSSDQRVAHRTTAICASNLCSEHQSNVVYFFCDCGSLPSDIMYFYRSVWCFHEVLSCLKITHYNSPGRYQEARSGKGRGSNLRIMGREVIGSGITGDFCPGYEWYQIWRVNEESV